MKFDVGGQLWPSIDHPDRWAQLALVWNANLAHLWPSQYAICVESDLIWDHTIPITCMRHVRQKLADVVYPMLMYTPRQFYDTHATFSRGQQWSAWPPYFPPGVTNDGRFVEVDHAGGMICTRGETLAQAQWDPTSCILKFPIGPVLKVDTTAIIRHPAQ